MFCQRASGGPLSARPGFSGFCPRKSDYELAVLIFTQLQLKNMEKTDSCTVKPCDGWANRGLWKGLNSPATPTPGSGSSGAHVCGC